MEALGVGLLGLGTVGSGMLRIFEENSSYIEARLGARLQIVRAAVRDPSKDRKVNFDRSRLTTDPREVIHDPEVTIVVELVGGVDQAAELVLEAIRSGKHVVTANKALLAIRGREIFDAASEHGVDVFYEGAVCGGIPIIRALRESFASERIDSILGIMNGTTNYVLSQMSKSGVSYEDALADAQRLGYAEADPSSDVDGRDAAQKLAILASLGFGARVVERDVHTAGIRSITPEDIEFASAHDHVIKSLGVAQRSPEDGSLSLGVHCAWVPDSSPLAHVSDAYNAVLIRTEALGDSLFYGQGAGQMPTGSAVAADVIDLARSIRIGATGRIPHLATQDDALSKAVVRDRALLQSSFYLRFCVGDVPGVLGRIATCLGEHGVSLRTVSQEDASGGQGMATPICAVTHEASEGEVRGALEEIDRFETTKAPTQLIHILAS